VDASRDVPLFSSLFSSQVSSLFSSMFSGQVSSMFSGKTSPVGLQHTVRLDLSAQHHVQYGAAGRHGETSMPQVEQDVHLTTQAAEDVMTAAITVLVDCIGGLV
jgi:Rod binding domain-containing protein